MLLALCLYLPMTRENLRVGIEVFHIWLYNILLYSKMRQESQMRMTMRCSDLVVAVFCVLGFSVT